MSICSCCYKTDFSVSNEIEVGHWWHNESFLAVVCSEKCKDELWNAKKNGTWMTRKPPAMFPQAQSKSKKKLPESITDKQFSTINE
jgi:hypothetical protein